MDSLSEGRELSNSQEVSNHGGGLTQLQILQQKLEAKSIELEHEWLQHTITKAILDLKTKEMQEKEKEWNEVGEAMIERYDELEKTTRELQEKSTPNVLHQAGNPEDWDK